jgi:protein subunit release factor B
MILKEKDLRIHYYKSSGPGGQRRNKKETAVRITHIPTGITAIATESRMQSLNQKIALERLKRRVESLTKKYKNRVATRVPIAVKENILTAKRIKAQKKIARRKNINSLLEEIL